MNYPWGINQIRLFHRKNPFKVKDKRVDNRNLSDWKGNRKGWFDGRDPGQEERDTVMAYNLLRDIEIEEEQQMYEMRCDEIKRKLKEPDENELWKELEGKARLAWDLAAREAGSKDDNGREPIVNSSTQPTGLAAPEVLLIPTSIPSGDGEDGDHKDDGHEASYIRSTKKAGTAAEQGVIVKEFPTRDITVNGDPDVIKVDRDIDPESDRDKRCSRTLNDQVRDGFDSGGGSKRSRDSLRSYRGDTKRQKPPNSGTMDIDENEFGSKPSNQKLRLRGWKAD
ncbi:hypothetical protein ABW19_dt0207069 [Dactylella cylindrospora]|nr:hypothetical protein ABW19_dt0207069 [Dactylella cylindrospora]